MRLRKNILPKTLKEGIITSYFMTIIPTFWYFELFVIFPTFYEIWSPEYNFHFTFTSILTFLTISHLAAVILTDPSINGRFPEGGADPEWKYCYECQSAVPPRSWHCKICNVCVLKRDHHCMMMSCCVGFDNQKYFFFHIFYLMVATTYGSIYNVLFIWNTMEPGSFWISLLKFICPAVGIFYIEWTTYPLKVCFILLVIFHSILSHFLVIWYIRLMFNNLTLFENKKMENKALYDKGIMENVKIVLGEKWYLIWLGPWVDSKLPVDGYHWDENESKNK